MELVKNGKDLLKSLNSFSHVSGSFKIKEIAKMKTQRDYIKKPSNAFQKSPKRNIVLKNKFKTRLVVVGSRENIATCRTTRNTARLNLNRSNSNSYRPCSSKPLVRPTAKMLTLKIPTRLEENDSDDESVNWNYYLESKFKDFV